MEREKREERGGEEGGRRKGGREGGREGRTLEGLTVSDGRAVWFFIPSARPTLPPAVPLHYWRGVGRGK